MFNETIKKLMEKMGMLPEALVVMYLKKMFGISDKLAHQAVFSACRSRICYKKGDYLVRVPQMEVDSLVRKKAKAFRLVVEFLPDSQDFSVGYSPWLMYFIRSNNLVQVCYIEKGMEMVSSRLIADKPIPAEERSGIKRIAILEPGCDINRIRKAGFSYFCVVSDDDFDLKIVEKVDEEAEAWADVPEK